MHPSQATAGPRLREEGCLAKRGGVVAFVLLLTLLPTPAVAAGFAVAEQGASALGVAGAATARSDLAETGFYNPAATKAGFVAVAGGSLIFPTIKHFHPETENLTKAESHAATPPYAHLGWVGEFDRHRFGVLLGAYVPFGAGLSWPKTWNGRFEVTSIELQVFEAQATTIYGISLSEDFEIGGSGSIRALRSTVELERSIDAIDTEPHVLLGGDANTLSGGAALWARIGDVQGGISYRGAAKLDFEGAAHFEDVPVELSGAAHDQSVKTSVSLPERIAFGVAYDLDFGVASLDAEYFHWSRFKTFGIDFEDDATPDVDEPRNWRNTVTIRAGYEHRLMEKRLALRAGGAFDPTPSPQETLSPTLPDASRVLFTLGAGYRFDFGLRADVAFANVVLMENTATGEGFPGVYSGGAQVLTLGIGYTLE